MKVTQLSIRNIGIITDETITLNKPLILFYGDIQQGKSTFLNAVRWCFGGSFPSDIIRHGQQEASIELTLDRGSITRTWYVAKDNSTKARPITYILDGKPVKNPVAEIEKLLNPFLLNQEHLRNMTELDRKRYFIDLFGVDTSDLDAQATQAAKDAEALRIKIKSYGDIDLTPYEQVDAVQLKSQLDSIEREHSSNMKKWVDEHTRIFKEHHAHVDQIKSKNDTAKQNNAQRTIYLNEIDELKRKLKDRQDWIADHPQMELSPLPGEPVMPERPTKPDTSALEKQVQDAAANNVRWEQYEHNKRRDESRKTDQKLLSELEQRQRELKAQKLAKLKSISESCKIKGLKFDDDGTFIYDGTQAGMLSTSQLMRLSSELSALYPPGFGLDLIDRGESLGTSIFNFVERAKREEKTIMAAIVGEKPAQVPEHVGVFVVKQGKAQKELL